MIKDLAEVSYHTLLDWQKTPVVGAVVVSPIIAVIALIRAIVTTILGIFGCCDTPAQRKWNFALAVCSLQQLCIAIGNIVTLGLLTNCWGETGFNLERQAIIAFRPQ